MNVLATYRTDESRAWQRGARATHTPGAAPDEKDQPGNFLSPHDAPRARATETMTEQQVGHQRSAIARGDRLWRHSHKPVHECNGRPFGLGWRLRTALEYPARARPGLDSAFVLDGSPQRPLELEAGPYGKLPALSQVALAQVDQTC